MDLFEAIRTRRSIRQYEDKPIPEDVLRQLLEAAMMAPSAGNAQPWQFLVVTERRLLDRVPDIHPYASMSKQAAAAVLICGDETLEKYAGNWPADCAAATENLLLAAHALGLAAVWTGVWPDQERCEAFRMMFEIPRRVVPLAYVPLGYSTFKPPTPERFRPERIHQNRW